MQPIPLSSGALAAAAEAERTWTDVIQDGVDTVFEKPATAIAEVVFFKAKLGSVEFPLVVAWLIIAAVVCTVYLGFVQLRSLNVAADTVRGKYSSDDDPGEVTHFQALTSAVSGTVGLGNIAGVGAAMAMGGAGATFWMIVAGLLGMATKFAECTLGVKYRKINEDGTVSGGPFRYLPVAYRKLTNRLGSTASSVISGVMTGIYAVSILLFALAGGNMFQANQTMAQVREVTGGDTGFMGSAGAAAIFGLILAGLVGLVIVGGMKSIGSVTSKLVPSMALVYVTACVLVIGMNITAVPAAFSAIVEGAFAADSIKGGVVGVMIIGFQRAAFSNEAGLGSAPIAHSAVKTKHPASEGFVAMFEPFIDTVVICTMTALAIIIADQPSFINGVKAVQADQGTPDGVVLTSDAFATVLPWFPLVLAVAVALFAFSTLITWSYYGQQAWFKLFGRGSTQTRAFQAVFLFFVVMGAVLEFGSVLLLADAALFVCGFVNLLAVYVMLPVIKSEMQDYLAKRREGKLIDLRGVESKTDTK